MPKGTKHYSDKQEKLVANYMSEDNDRWCQVKGSGARPNFPGDVLSKDWLVECKTYTKPNQQLIFVFKVWDKIYYEASGIFKKPVLVTDDGSQRLEKTYCMVCLDRNPNHMICTDYSDKSSYRETVSNIEKHHGIEYITYKDQLLLICSLSVFKELIRRKVI